MVKHIVAWNFADNLSDEEKQKNAEIIKIELENLKNLIPGIVSINLYTAPLHSSDSDLFLDSVFENEEALLAYQQHPAHVRVASQFVRPVTKNRKCIDFIMD